MFDDFNQKTFSTSELQINNIIQIRKTQVKPIKQEDAAATSNKIWRPTGSLKPTSIHFSVYWMGLISKYQLGQNKNAKYGGLLQNARR